MKNFKLKSLVIQLCPPIVLPGLKKLYRLVVKRKIRAPLDPNSQDIAVYWDPEMAQILETWGEGNVWNEIQLLMVNCQGKVLDIACGTGKTMEVISKFPAIEVYGCDISDLLISKALNRGLMEERLKVADATNLPFADNSFEYGYSIGSLEHFTEEGIMKFLSECYRVVNKTSFHQHPISRSGKNEGWISPYQSYHNNTVEWWLEKYKAVYSTVYVIDSTWEDDISVGKWFVCMK